MYLGTFRQFQFNFKFAINKKQNNDERLESSAKKIITDILCGVKIEDLKSSKKVWNYIK